LRRLKSRTNNPTSALSLTKMTMKINDLFVIRCYHMSLAVFLPASAPHFGQ
jgi:hypothetical protein